MTLNSTIFPELGLATVVTDFNRLVLGSDGAAPELLERRMGFYASLLEDSLASSGAWHSHRRLILAHSFGGMLALWWLANRATGAPPGPDGLVLISTTAGPMYDRLRLKLGFGLGGPRIAAGPILPLWNLAAVTRTVKWIICGGSLEVEDVDFRAEGIQSDLQLDLAGWRNTDWRAMRSYRLAMEGFDVRNRLSDLTLPTIVLHGTEDSLLDVDAAQDLADGLPHAELRLVEGAGHALPVTHGGEIERAVQDLIDL
jgi:pimeloyl-ACP methyl ester carboxylesterase